MALGIPGQYNTGVQQSISIVRNDTGATVILDGGRTRFTSKAEDELLKSNVMDNGGRVVPKVIPGGWGGTIDVERGTADFSDLYAFLETNYYAGGGQVYFTITETNQRADMSGSDSFQYVNSVFHGYDPGTWARNEIVKGSVQFFASERNAV